VLPGITGWAQVNYRTARASRMHDESCSTTSITSAMPLRSWTWEPCCALPAWCSCAKAAA